MSNALGCVAFADSDQRQFPRLPIKCRARIKIGNRQYNGYVENLLEGGAKLVTFTPIRDVGYAVLRMPDLPPIRGHLRWAEEATGGMAFSLTLPSEQLSEWVRNRTGSTDD